MKKILLLLLLVTALGVRGGKCGDNVFPGVHWETRTPGQVGMSREKLDALKELVGGRDWVGRHGYMVYSWGDQSKSFDVASAFKPVLSTLRQQTADPPKTELGLRAAYFTLNGKPTFLYGISYYGALGAPEDFIRRDVDDMQRLGFNWIRVWANWRAFGADAAAVDGEGHPIPAGLEKLKRLVADCDRRGMVVDVSLSRGNGVSGPPRLQTLEAHRRAVESVVTALQTWRNWYLDLSNERNIRDKRFASFADLRTLRDLAKELNPGLLITASHGGDIARNDLGEYLQTARVDFVSPHRPREARSPAQTANKSRELLAWMKELKRTVPVHFQEPFRRGFGTWNPKAEDFMADLRGAIIGGAAGWCFHNGDERDAPEGQPRRSFGLRETRLFDQLDEHERKAVDLLETVVKQVPSAP